MSYIPLGLFALLIAVADQISKYFVVKHIPYGGFVPLWDGVLHLTYVQNYGAAFSVLRGSDGCLLLYLSYLWHC